MTFMDRQHNLTIRFVSIVSVMNIHGWRIVRFVNTLDDLYQAGVLENEEYIAEHMVGVFATIFMAKNSNLT